ncbi:HEPN domain-containing protein [Nonomuraea sp. NPDC050663]|uniref:ApeA N-terminal domain 1-containing protein n=1 Tax=Nonomuraea sp. NPDC050663 TaxID=3364370 RepID=UPI00378C2DB8
MGLKPGRISPAEWWIPGSTEDTTIPGVCEVKEDGRILARLHRNPSIPAGQASFLFAPLPKIPILHGSVFGTEVTLVDCRTGGTRSGLSPIADIELRPWFGVEGQLLSEEELNSSKAEVRLRGQREWAAWSAFAYEIDGSHIRPRSLTYEPPPARTATIPGGSVTIKDDSILWPNGPDAQLKSQCSFVIDLESPVPLRDFLRTYTLPLEVLLSLATSSMARIESLYIAANQPGTYAGSEDQPEWLKVWFGYHGARDSPREIAPEDILFELSDYNWEELGGRIFTIANEWRYIIDQWIALNNPRYHWRVPRFLTTVTVLEGVDRLLNDETQSDRAVAYERIANDVKLALETVPGLNSKRRARIRKLIADSYEPSLEDRLARLGAKVASGMSALNLDEDWPARVAKLRNQVGHGLPAARALSDDNRAAQAGEAILIHLLECLFLSELGLDDQRIAKVARRRCRMAWRSTILTEGYDKLPKGD